MWTGVGSGYVYSEDLTDITIKPSPKRSKTRLLAISYHNALMQLSLAIPPTPSDPILATVMRMRGELYGSRRHCECSLTYSDVGGSL